MVIIEEINPTHNTQNVNIDITLTDHITSFLFFLMERIYNYIANILGINPYGIRIEEPIETNNGNDKYDEWMSEMANYVECNYIDTSMIPGQPSYYYQQFENIFYHKNKYKNTAYQTCLSSIFKAHYISLNEWKEFVTFCSKLTSIDWDNTYIEFIYNVLNENMNTLSFDQKNIYRDIRENRKYKHDATIHFNKRAINLTFALISIIQSFPNLIQSSIHEIFDDLYFNELSNFTDFNELTVFLMTDSRFFLYFRVINWLSIKIMKVLMIKCLKYELKKQHTLNRMFGVLPDSIFYDDDGVQNIDHFKSKRIGWIKITNGYYRFFEIDKLQSNQLQIKHICPLYWQCVYIGKHGLDTIMFRYDHNTNHVIWEYNKGILLYRTYLTLKMDGFTVGSAINDDDEEDDDDIFIVFGLKYNGIKYNYKNGENRLLYPSYSSGMYKNLGYFYTNNSNDVFFNATNRLKTKQDGEFEFVPYISYDKDDEFVAEIIAFLIFEDAVNKYIYDGNEDCDEYQLLIAEIYNNDNIKYNDFDNSTKNEKIRYLSQMVEEKKDNLWEKLKKRENIPIQYNERNKRNKRDKGSKRNKRKRKKQRNDRNRGNGRNEEYKKNEDEIKSKINEYMTSWLGHQRIKYKDYLNMMNDIGKYLNFDENINMIKRRGSHPIIHFKNNIKAIPIIPRPHGKQGNSVSLYVVKRWLKQNIYMNE